MWKTSATDCGPFVYEIDPICAQFISVEEDSSSNELVFTYNQPWDAELRTGFVQPCEMMVTLENYPEAYPGFTSWMVNITDSNACPRNSEYLQPSNTLDAITHVLSTENTPGLQYTVPLPVLEWAPKPCFKISSIEVIDPLTGGPLEGDLASLIVIGPSNLLVTVPENQTDDSSIDLIISYALNDTQQTSFTQDFSIEFLAPDLCL